MEDLVSTSDEEDDDNNSKDNFKVTPWEVEGEIDYNKLIVQFGTQPITSEIIERIKHVTGEVHPMLKLQYFFSHRDLDWILNKHRDGESFYLYTGRGPSGMIHIGHVMPWLFTKYLQEKFDSKLLFQLTDDEKFLQTQDRSSEEIRYYTYENVLDI
ncbi:MAG: tryptophan--tRNA ligase, partial [Candidatus Nitrosopolaris sp.]